MAVVRSDLERNVADTEVPGASGKGCGGCLLEYSYSKENRPEEEDLKSNQIEFPYDISVNCEG